MRLITEHFAIEEFACHDGTPYPFDRPDEEDRDPTDGIVVWGESRLFLLCKTLEVVRAFFGRPIDVLSGYRSMRWNRLKKSRDTSQHPKGRASDIKVRGVPASIVHDRVLELYEAGELPHLGGLGDYPGFTHLDVRPRPEDNHLARWMEERDPDGPAS